MDKMCNKSEAEELNKTATNVVDSENFKNRSSPVFKCFNNTKPLRGNNLDSSDYDIPSYQVNQSIKSKTSSKFGSETKESVLPFSPIFSPVPVAPSAQFQPPSVHTLSTVTKNVEKACQNKVNNFSNSSRTQTVKPSAVFDSLGMNDKDISWVSSMATPPPKNLPGSEFNTVEKATFFPEEKFQNIQPRALFSPTLDDDFGCHPIVFTSESDGDDDEYKSNIRLSDVCATLKQLEVKSLDLVQNNSVDAIISPIIKTKRKKLGSAKKKKKGSLVISPENTDKYDFAVGENLKGTDCEKVKSNSGSNFIEDDSFQSMSFSGIDELCKTLVSEQSNNSVLSKTVDSEKTLMSTKENNSVKKFYFTKTRTDVFEVSSMDNLHSYAKALEESDKCNKGVSKTNQALPQTGIIRFDILNKDNPKTDGTKRSHSEITEENDDCKEKKLKKIEDENLGWDNVKHYLSESQLNVSDGEIFRTVENLEKTLASQGSDKQCDEKSQGGECTSSQNSDLSRTSTEITDKNKEKSGLNKNQALECPSETSETSGITKNGQNSEVCIPSVPIVAFTTASGSRISVSEKALQKAREILKECDENELKKPFSEPLDQPLKEIVNLKPEQEMSSKVLMKGFSTGSHKQIKVYAEALRKARTIMSECEVPESEKHANWMNIQGQYDKPMEKSGDNMMGGFCTGSGKQIHISVGALEKAKVLMSEFDSDENELFPKNVVAGFLTGSGKKIQVSVKALEKAKALLAECEGSEENLRLKNNKMEFKQNKIFSSDNNSKENLSRTENLMEGLVTNYVKTTGTSENAKSGRQVEQTEKSKKMLNIFKDPSICAGKTFQVSAGVLEKTIPLMENCESELKESSGKTATNHELDNEASHLMEGNKGSDGTFFDHKQKEAKWGNICFSTASGNAVRVSKNALEKAKQLWASCSAQEETAENVREISKTSTFPQSKSPAINFTTAGGRKVTVSEAALAKAKERMREWEQIKADDSGNFACILNNLETSASDGLEVPEKTTKSEEKQMSTTSGIEESDEWQEIIPSWLHVYNTSPSIASERPGLSPVLCHEDGKSIKPDREYIIRSPVLGSSDRFHGKRRKRKLRFEDETKSQEKAFAAPNKNLEKERKSTAKRTSTLDFSVPFKKMKFVEGNAVTCLNVKAERARAREQQENIIKEKQKVKPTKGSHLSRKCSEKQISWKEATAGSAPEMHSDEFLRSFGIREDVLRISIENAISYRFKGEDFFDSTCSENIVGFPVGDECLLILDDDNKFGVEELKRAFLASPGVQPNLVSHGWVENHLKWIMWKLANYERCFPQYFGGSCLTPTNLMLQLKYRYDREIDRNERSALRKILERDDTSIKRLVLCICDIQKIAVGESVGYKLILTDGWYSCPAHTDPAMTRLIEEKKLRIGMKLVTQGATLVNCEQGVSPLEISEDVYLKISTNSTRRIRWDAKLGFQKNPENFPISLGSILPQGGPISRIDVIIVRVYPTLYMEKTSDGRHVTRNRRSEEKAESEYRRIQEQRMESLCNEIQSEELIPADQRNLVEKVHSIDQNDRVRLELREKIEKKLEKEKLNKRNVSEFLRAKIVDFRKPDFNNPAVLTVWNPNEDLTVLLSEGKVISFMNVTISNSSRIYKPLQINTTRQTQYRQIVRNSVKYPARKLTWLKDVSSKICPAFEEVDVVGMVALIRDVSYGSRMSQVIYLTDLDMNYIGIVFWGSCKEYGWENVLRIPSIVACSNLQWKKNYTPQNVPSLYVNENSVFTENPKQQYLKEEIERLKQSMPQDKAAFLSSCEEDLTTKLEDSKWQTNSSKNSSANDPNLVRVPPKPRVLNGFESKPTASSTPIKPFSGRMHSDEAEPSPIQKRIEKLQSYGEPPSLIPLLIRNNAKKKFKKKS